MKTVLITGANRGIGLGLVKQYLEKGDRVFAACRTPETAKRLGEAASRSGERLTVLGLELSRTGSFEGFASEVAAATGHLDLLINNAGIYPENRFADVTVDQIQSAFLVNAAAPVLLTRALTGLLCKGTRPLVVNISSLLGSVSRGAGTGRWADYSYGPSKAALNRMTRQLAIDLRTKGIIVVAQNPGWVRTDMGGADAPLSVDEAVSVLYRLFGTLTMADTGRLLEPDGSDAAW